MSPKEHDKQAAYSLAMTHYIGRVLSELKLKRQDIVTVGYDSLLRVIEQTTNDSWQLSHDMLRLNPYVKDMRKDVTGAVNKVEKKLD
jgi:prephenate dehydrogenase